MQKTRIYLAPGMFGFARLASLEYFEHFIRALEDRFRDRGRHAEIHVCEVHPTASILRRAAKLARLVDESAGTDGGPIHIIGHSTGGLDARLVASPTVRLPGNAHLGFPGCEGDSLLMLLDARGIECSTGSACSAGVPQPSHVLLAMGCDADQARHSLRFSLGHTTTPADIDALVKVIGPVVERARAAKAR